MYQARFLFFRLFWLRLVLLLALSLLAWQAEAMDLNKATQTELQQIKGIGPKTAERIIDERNRGGPFTSLQDLSDRVKGIGPKRIITLQASGLHTENSASTVKLDNKNSKKQP